MHPGRESCQWKHASKLFALHEGQTFQEGRNAEQAVHRAQLDQGEVGATQEGGRARGTGFSRGHGIKRSGDEMNGMRSKKNNLFRPFID